MVVLAGVWGEHQSVQVGEEGRGPRPACVWRAREEGGEDTSREGGTGQCTAEAGYRAWPP